MFPIVNQAFTVHLLDLWEPRAQSLVLLEELQRQNFRGYIRKNKLKLIFTYRAR